MNLAQFIDPAWVRERFPERVERRERAPQPVPAPVPEAVVPEDVPVRIRKVLEAALVRLTLAEIREQLPDVPATTVAANITLLVQRKDVDVNGIRRNYRYGLTERGRSRLRG